MKPVYIRVTFHKATGLKPLCGRLGQPVKPYTIVYLAGLDIDSEPLMKTLTDYQGNTNPSWNCDMVIELQPEALINKELLYLYNLICEIKHDSLWLDRCIGKVTIPLHDLLVDREKISYLVTKNKEGHGELVLSHYRIPPPPAAGGGGGGGGENGAHADTPIPVSKPTCPPAELLSAQAPLLPARATTSKPLVAMHVVAASTTIVDNVVNLIDFFG